MNNYSTLLRIDKTLYEKIRELAKQQKRSINSQMIFILQSYIDMVSK